MIPWNFSVLKLISILIALPHPKKTAIRLSRRFQCEVHILDESLSFLFKNRLSIFLSYASRFFRNKLVCLEPKPLFPGPLMFTFFRSKLKISFTFFRQSFITFMTQCTYLRLTQSGSHETHKKSMFNHCGERNVDMKVEFLGQWMTIAGALNLTHH